MAWKFKDVLDWGRRLAWLWALLSGSAVAGVVTAWIAHGTSWLNQYGLIAWWFAGLIGFVLSAFGLGVIAWLRLKWITANAVSKWEKQVEAINPLDKEFSSKRIRIADLEHPVSHKIANKRFTDCELVGPANIILTGTGSIYDVQFGNCDIVATRPDAFITNIIVFENVSVVRGAFLKCTIFVPIFELPKFMAIPNTTSVSITGITDFDRRKFNPK